MKEVWRNMAAQRPLAAFYLFGLTLLLFGCSSQPFPFSREETQSSDPQSDLSTFDRLTENSRYNKQVPPTTHEGGPVVVNTSLFLYSMTSLDDLRTEYHMHMLFRQMWRDHRLRYTREGQDEQRPIEGGSFFITRIWTPTLDVINSKELGALDLRGDTASLMHLYPDGKVIYSRRVHLRATCMMTFYRYPLDRQTCSLCIESSVLTVDKLLLRWADENALKLNDRFDLTGFVLENFTLEHHVGEYWSTGNFSKLLANFHIRREFGHFLLDLYIPGIMLVVVSWTGFWIEIPAAPARVTLCVTSLLTLITSEKMVREKLPKVNYIHALDIWNVSSIAFIFATLIEYAMVNYIYHKEKRRRQGGMRRVESTATMASLLDTDTTSVFSFKAKQQLGRSQLRVDSPAAVRATRMKSSASAPNLQIEGEEFQYTPLTPQDIANNIDRLCRYIFPAGFAIFNIIYWTILLAH